MPRRTSRLAALAIVMAALGGLTACAADVPMEAAPQANDPACADVIVRLPDTVAGLERRTTNAQATGAWGDPANVLLYCGITPSGPTTDECVNVNGVDWIIDPANAPLYRFEAYGRNPGLQVVVDSESVSGIDAITALSSAAALLPQERQCLAVSDTRELDPDSE